MAQKTSAPAVRVFYNIRNMQKGLDAMKVALRVLSAITERVEPAAEDLETLRAYAASKRDLPPDELACEVIQLAIKARAEARGAGL
jgi:hypothetical protein